MNRRTFVALAMSLLAAPFKWFSKRKPMQHMATFEYATKPIHPEFGTFIIHMREDSKS